MIFQRALWSLLILVAAHAAMAVEYAEEKNLSVSGRISSVDVAQQLVRILDDAITMDASHSRLIGVTPPESLDQLTAGMDIVVTFDSQRRDDSGHTVLLAQSIAVSPAGTILGEVWSLNIERNTFTILGQEIQATPETRWAGTVSGRPIDGVRFMIPNVRFEVELAKGLPLRALRVTALPNKPSQNFHTQGIVYSIEGDRWIVLETGGRRTTFVVPDGTEIVGGPVLPLDTVSVHARMEPELNVAHRINVLRIIPSGPCSAPSLSLEGVLTARTADSITVDAELRGPTTLRVTAATIFHLDPQPGDKVTVLGDYDEQYNLHARKVIKEVEPVPAVRTTIEGTITVQDGKSWTVGDYTVQVDEHTRVQGTPVLGDRVRILGWLQGNFMMALLVEEL